MTTNPPTDYTVHYEVTTQLDENGDLLIPLSKELLEILKWSEGQQVQFGIDALSGRYVISAVNSK